MMRWKLILFLLLVFLSPSRSNAQLLAVSSDVALLAVQTYNVGAEMTVGNRSTLGLNVMGNYHPWILHDMRAWAVIPEWRYYVSGRPMMYHFVGLTGVFCNYDFDWKGENYHGDAAGLGLSFGYVLPLSERVNLDFHTGVGFFFYHEKGRGVGNMILPTKLGISLSYILK